MSKDLYVQISHAGTQITTRPIYLQLDTMSQSEAAYYGGAAPYFRYQVFLLQPFGVQQGDLLVDTVNIDPHTSTNYHYRVISDPEGFPDQHMEMVVDRVRGT